MSVAEARRYFERVAAPTRAGSEEGTLTLGTYMPDWSLATVSAGEVLSSTDVPVRGEFRYFVIGSTSTANRVLPRSTINWSS